MLLCMHVQDALPLTDLAEIGPCNLQEAMARVSRMVELGVLELIVDDEPLLPHFPLPELLRSVAPANASQPPDSSSAVAPQARPSTAPRIASLPPPLPLRKSRPPVVVETSRLVPSNAPRAPSAAPAAAQVGSEVWGEERLTRLSSAPAALEPEDESAAYEDDPPPTGVRPRFCVDPRAARRALLGAIVLERRAPATAKEPANRRVRRRVPSST